MLGVSHLQNTLVRPTIEIEASIDTQTNTVPVYAQFVVTQGLRLASEGPVTHIELPVHESAPGQDFQVVLYGDEVVGEWDMQTTATDAVVRAQLPLSIPQTLAGHFSLEIAAEGIDHAHKDSAPRVYIQTADDYYPDGNYRIAQNEKNGDVALVIFEEVTNWRVLQEDWQAYPLNAAKAALLVLLGLVLIIGLAWLPVRD